MTALPNWTHPTPKDSILLRCLLMACLLELLVLTAMGWHTHWLAHPQKTNTFDESRFVQAEVFEYPDEARLVEKSKPPQKAVQPKAISTTPIGKKTATQTTTELKNQTESGPEVNPDHGPVAIYTPPPEIPPYLRDQNFHTYVLIDFFVTAQGAVTPRLVGSSGSEELDAIALDKVASWQFRPAERDHKTIDAKVRLRIIFEVR